MIVNVIVLPTHRKGFPSLNLDKLLGVPVTQTLEYFFYIFQLIL